MERGKFFWTSQLKDDKWTPTQPVEVGKLDEEGKLHGKMIAHRALGGVAVTTFNHMTQVDEDTVQNEATGDIFYKTKSGKGFWNRRWKIFAK